MREWGCGFEIVRLGRRVRGIRGFGIVLVRISGDDDDGGEDNDGDSGGDR